jgi:ABC-type polysaccharide/polyol phosphate transport system ATPase subunit
VSTDIAVTVDDLAKRFRIYHERNQYLKASLLRGRRARYEEFWAIDGVSFEVPRGETFGIIGPNGSGKSTMLKCLTRILRPDRGSVTVNGSLSALLELGAGFHPELSGRENIFLNAAILGLSRKQIAAKFDEIVSFADLERFIDTPVKNYSSGMFVRLGFAVAINVDPEILIIDEVLAVGDESFQRKCAEKIADFRSDGRTIVLVSHGLSQLRQLCDRIAWIDHGKLHRLGAAPEVIDEYAELAQVDRVVVAARAEDGQGGSVRWGSGEARIERIELLDRCSLSNAKPRTGEPLTVRIYYAARVPTEEPIFGFSITQLEGAVVTSTSTARHREHIDKIAGDGWIDFVIPSLPLLEGVYDLSVAITDRTEQHQIDRWQHALRFNVARGDVVEDGIATLGGHWEFGTLDERAEGPR